MCAPHCVLDVGYGQSTNTTYCYKESQHGYPTKVAYTCNILSMEGHTDTIYGHVSARAENAEQSWMKPATLGLEEVRPLFYASCNGETDAER
jgi:hypothetical protein